MDLATQSLTAAPSTASIAPHRSRNLHHMPGELGIWAFVCADLLVFTLYFVTFLWERAQEPAAFALGSQSLNLTIGVINTLMLLTSSLFVALAVHGIRSGRGANARNYLLLALVGGGVFIINKPVEWFGKVRSGHGPHHDDFFQLYYMMTGLHLLHVLVGMIVLTRLLALRCAIPQLPNARQTRFLENGATYWHLVDLIWLVLFALFYLLR